MGEQQFEQHSLIKSVLLHLIPGIPILFGFFLFSQPLFAELLGIDVKLRVMLGLNLTGLFTLVSLQLGIMFYEGKKLNGRYTLKGVFGNTEKSSLKDYLIFVPILLIFTFLVFALVAPTVNRFIVGILFSWYPEEYNIQKIDESIMINLGTLQTGIFLLLAFNLVMSGILVPFVEELYFRGYLLPRMEHYANKWAPAINVTLFSLYYFFSPWENPIRIIVLLPLIYLVWRKKDMRFSMLVRILKNTSSSLILLMAVLVA